MIRSLSALNSVDEQPAPNAGESSHPGFVMISDAMPHVYRNPSTGWRCTHGVPVPNGHGRTLQQ
jgi:hypothetical protein